MPHFLFQDQDGNSPLHLACTESNVPVVKLLVSEGANLNISDVDGETALIRLLTVLMSDYETFITIVYCHPNTKAVIKKYHENIYIDFIKILFAMY